MKCSVGTFINEECHKCVYGLVKKDVRLIDDLSEENRELIFLRVNESIANTCAYPELKFLVKYHHLYGNSYCDHLRIHKTSVTKGLRKIQLVHLSQRKNQSINLIPGTSLCPTCYTRIFVRKDECSIDDGDFIPPSDHINIINSPFTI